MLVSLKVLTAAVEGRIDKRTEQLLLCPRPLLRLPLLRCLSDALDLERVSRATVRLVLSGGEGGGLTDGAVAGASLTEGGRRAEARTWQDNELVEVLSLRSVSGGECHETWCLPRGPHDPNISNANIYLCFQVCLHPSKIWRCPFLNRFTCRLDLLMVAEKEDTKELDRPLVTEESTMEKAAAPVLFEGEAEKGVE